MPFPDLESRRFELRLAKACHFQSCNSYNSFDLYFCGFALTKKLLIILKTIFSLLSSLFKIGHNVVVIVGKILKMDKISEAKQTID